MKNKILYLISVLLVISYTLNAQVILQKQIDSKGLTTSIRFETNVEPVSMNKAKEVLNSINKMQTNDEWLMVKSETDKVGTKHQYFQQYHKGIRVAYAIYSIHGNNKDQIESAIGNYQNIDNLNTAPQLSETEALQYATKHIGAEIYKWQVPEEEKWIAENLNNSYYPKGELLVVKDISNNSNQYHLAYKFDVYAHKPLS